MDIHGKSGYDKNNDDVEVIKMSAVHEKTKETEVKYEQDLLESLLAENPPKDAKALRKLIGVRSESGVKIVDLYKQGR